MERRGWNETIDEPPVTESRLPAHAGSCATRSGTAQALVIANRTRIVHAVVACALGVMLVTSGQMAWGESGGPVDLNRASVEELTELPGIGPAKAAAIVEERARHPFGSIEELTRVSGIGERTLEQLRGRVSVGGADGGSGESKR